VKRVPSSSSRKKAPLVSLPPPPPRLHTKTNGRGRNGRTDVRSSRVLCWVHTTFRVPYECPSEASHGRSGGLAPQEGSHTKTEEQDESYEAPANTVNQRLCEKCTLLKYYFRMLPDPKDMLVSHRTSWGILPQTPVFSLRSARCHR
jgi:hypothetical protein